MKFLRLLLMDNQSQSSCFIILKRVHGKLYKYINKFWNPLFCSMYFENNELLESEEYEVVKENDELLIDAVRAYPHLYNHQDQNFKDHMMKENSWKEIALAINVSVSECQTRWIRLRERFGKEKRQRELDTKSGSGASRRSGFTYYDNMLFLNDHIKKRKSFTNVSNLKRLKTTKVITNRPDTYVSSALSTSTIERDREELNLPTESAANENTNFLSPKNLQFSNVENTPIQPCANFLTQFKKKFLPDTGSASSMTSLEGDSSILSNLPKHFSNARDSLDESDESTTTRSSMFSTRDSTPSPLSSKNVQSTLSQKPSKKNNSTELESSLISLCQTMHDRLQDNRHSEITNNPDETFARLIINQLGILPMHEKQKRQQAIMQILYAPYDS